MTAEHAVVTLTGDRYKVKLLKQGFTISTKEFPVVKQKSWLAGAASARQQAIDFAHRYVSSVSVIDG